LGDEIQAAKAGLMEIGDIFVINKADKETADRAAQEIHSMVMISEPSNGWRPPVLKTVATTGEGITGLIEAINQHMECFKRSAMANISDSDRIRSKILEAAKEYFEDVELKQISASERFHNVVEQVKARKVDPYTAGRKLVTRNRHL
jgi:LAO/AO transport system kinase